MFRSSRISGFHESYYDHPCPIVSERDVLETDIKGDGWIAACRRKWHDLFLLSYSDEKAGDYYHSTHAMKLDRRYHFHRHRYCIHPMSKFRLYWDIFMLHALILYKIHVFCMTSIIACTLPRLFYYLAMLFEICMILDIIINARTGFIDSINRKVVLNKQLSVVHYVSSKLFFHAFSAIPLVFITFLRYGDEIDCAICKANYFICSINFLTLINLFRVYELSSYWLRKSSTIRKTVFYQFLRIGVIVTLIIIQFLHFSDTISVLSIMTTPINQTGNISSDHFFNRIIRIKLISNRSDDFVMNAQLWRIVTFLTKPNVGMMEMTSYAVIYPHPLMKFLAYGLFAICIGWLMMEFFYVFTHLTFVDNKIFKRKEYLLSLAKYRQLPEQSRKKIEQYFKYTAARVYLIEQKNGLYRALPQVLKNEISWHCYRDLIMGIPYFSDWPRDVIEKLVFVLHKEIYLKNDMIAEMGVQGEGLMIVHAGVLAVYTSENEEMGHLIDGDYFGELSLVTDREVRASSVVAVSTCTVVLLEKILFRQIMRGYPQLFYALKEELKRERQHYPGASSEKI